MTWEGFLFLILASSSLGYSGYRFQTLFHVLKNHRGKTHPLGNWAERVQTAFLDILGQRAVLRKKIPGIIHTTIFWGFLIISIGTLEQFISTLNPHWSLEFLGTFYWVLMGLQDCLTYLVLLAVLAACYRRFILRPEGLGQSQDANRVLLLTGSLMLSIALMHGCELQTDPAWARWMPLSRGLSYLLENGNPELYAFGSHFFKWIHMLLVLGFAMYIPHSKHLHIVAAGPNTFLKNLKKTKAMRTISFEDPEVSQYGASKLTDLSWKDALDYYACTECGRCQDVCPAYQTQKPLSPKKLILDLKHAMQDQKETILAKNYEALPSILDLHVTEDVIWACTSCRACEIACPVFIEHTDKIFDIRRNLVMMESRFPPEVQTVFKNMENQGTPWAFSPETRSDWAEGLSIKTVAENPEIDILLWVGCAGAYDERNKKVVRAFASLLKKAQVKFAILGNEERCTGDPARRMGNEYLYQTLARSNIEVLQRYQVKKIVTSCPHCLNTLKNEYPDLGGHYEVFHHAQYLAMLIAQGKIKPSKNYEESITFHDSCYLGRWNGIYQEPREILRSVGANPVEMKSHRQESLCCGAGGGRMWMEEHLGKRINLARTEQALETGASTIATSCPFCLTMLSDGVQSKMATQTKVLDIAELLNEKS